MERFGASFLIAGVLTFLLGFVLQGLLPVLTLRKLPIASVAEIAKTIPPEFHQLAEDYPDEFKRYFGEVNPTSFAHALEVGKANYIAEACWHCHSQFVRPVSKEDLRFGPVSQPGEYQNMMNLPHLFGTRRVGPDLIRESGKHSNDWHVAHFYDPRSVAPYSVMPAYPWFFDEQRRPTERGLALVAYVQWLGSWVTQVPATIYNVDALQGGS
ncbi:MAG: cbb3-type cytochrome c oxidase subunit II [Deltaproteobacteria bacterium]|nr:cbb3-type cytochrome c oxidase subunit II [Deltaproteobacteria bacterium]MBI3386920.1 cbb3-type cytochrome c oxidase subunit II [Deltaproteobacteria bacterium]